MEHKITTENILKAAEKCPQAKETLKTMFPEAFEQEKYIELNSDCERNHVFAKDDVSIAIAVGCAPKDLRHRCFLLFEGTVNWELKRNGEHLLLIPTRK